MIEFVVQTAVILMAVIIGWALGRADREEKKD